MHRPHKYPGPGEFARRFVEEWNADNPVGSLVVVVGPDDRGTLTRTETPASGGGIGREGGPMVRLEGIGDHPFFARDADEIQIIFRALPGPYAL